ncbi:MAG: DUF3000 domain-containing protein [Pontimonas sp.]|nr:DUF3000 domain-containing protein [Pontimonas sp.]
MSSDAAFSDAPQEFLDAMASADSAALRTELRVFDTAAPEGLAPFQRAWAADVEPRHASSDNEYGTGRLVFLYDPSVPEAWESAYRMVVFAQAPIEPLMGQDEFLPNVAWSWLIDALDSSGASYFHAAGTTTSVVSTGFGEMESEGSGAQVEVRASWSPTTSEIGPHLEAWSEFVCMLAGFPPADEGVATLPPSRTTS